MSQHEHVEAARAPQPSRHEHIRSLLPEYAMLRASGASPGAEWHELQAHLATCAECRNEVEELCQVLVDTYTGTLDAAGSYPEPDLSFLPARSQGAATTDLAVHEQAGAKTPESSGSSIPTSIRQLLIQFTETVVAALQQPMLAGDYRGSHYCSYEHPRQSDQDLHVTIDISITDEERKLCRVLVCVVDPSDPFNQDGHGVMTRFDTHTRDATTDNHGYAAFDDLPLDAITKLAFTITPHQHH